MEVYIIVTVRDEINRAINNKQSIDIIYDGGSQPGLPRIIHPLELTGDKVKARCIRSNKVKLFSVQKITIINKDQVPDLTQQYIHTPLPPVFTDVNDVLKFYRDTLTGQGWHIISNSETISLHRYFKNGNPKKGADVSLHYEEYTYDAVFDGEEYREENKRKRTRPWIVRAKSNDTCTYGTLNKAADKFIEWSTLLSEIK